MTLAISVIICAHNPRSEYLSRVLSALQTQTLSKEQWELLLIDNASDSPLDQRIDLSWHPKSKHLYERKLGILYARLCGIQHANADLILFVDDDNILTQDYLETALKIGREHPELGAWGGQCIAEFEEKPPDWTQRFWIYLAIKEFDRDILSERAYQPECLPVTAGGCYRKVVSDAYLELVNSDSRRAMLGQKGSLLLRGEDLDLGYTAYDLGFGVGLFTSLKLKHLMPADRLKEGYLINLVAGSKYSELLLAYLRGRIARVQAWKHRLRLMLSSKLWLISPKMWLMAPQERRFYLAQRKASIEAMIQIYHLQNSVKQSTL
ncbi:MAG: glycosyltransferase family 2 protein [Scytolyngbya sp. HA4215-MV1]|jgi:glycosyltransferase involved in cell wall biosynthesis|nr:glycosyltransferase family 2 protein [Scytolyngbya sp. HA4215-MV1]